jgi:hypothetical protein
MEEAFDGGELAEGGLRGARGGGRLAAEAVKAREVGRGVQQLRPQRRLALRGEQHAAARVRGVLLVGDAGERGHLRAAARPAAARVLVGAARLVHEEGHVEGGAAALRREQRGRLQVLVAEEGAAVARLEEVDEGAGPHAGRSAPVDGRHLAQHGGRDETPQRRGALVHVVQRLRLVQTGGGGRGGGACPGAPRQQPRLSGGARGVEAITLQRLRLGGGGRGAECAALPPAELAAAGVLLAILAAAAGGGGALAARCRAARRSRRRPRPPGRQRGRGRWPRARRAWWGAPTAPRGG